MKKQSILAAFIALTIASPAGAQSLSGPMSPPTLGSTLLPFGQSTTSVSGLTLASPTLSGTVAGTPTFSGALTLSSALTYGGVTLGNSVTGTGSMVLATSPTLTTPTLGSATATSINKVTITAPASSSTLTIADGKTLGTNNSLTLQGTDNTVFTFPSSSDTVATLGQVQTISGVKTFTQTAGPAFSVGNSTTQIKGAGALCSAAGAAGTTTGTSEQTLFTCTLPTNGFDGNGRRIRFYTFWTKAANTDTVTMKMYFGSQSWQNDASSSTGGLRGWATMDVVKTGSNTQQITAQATTMAGGVASTAISGTQTDGSPITIKATCTDTTSAANDCTLVDAFIEFLN